MKCNELVQDFLKRKYHENPLQDVIKVKIMNQNSKKKIQQIY